MTPGFCWSARSAGGPEPGKTLRCCVPGAVGLWGDDQPDSECSVKTSWAFTGSSPHRVRVGAEHTSHGLSPSSTWLSWGAGDGVRLVLGSTGQGRSLPLLYEIGLYEIELAAHPSSLVVCTHVNANVVWWPWQVLHARVAEFDTCE